MAMYGLSKKGDFVVVIRPAGEGAMPSYLIFDARDRDPTSLALKVESLDFDRQPELRDELEAIAPGLQSSRSCQGWSLAGEETDSNPIY